MYNINGVMESHFRIFIVIVATLACLSAHIILTHEYIIKGKEVLTKKENLGVNGSNKLKNMFEDY